ncbi:unnamed protein product [Periconia digitata]|uniref:R3H domain-containing protein n=1 Tax=Periconia digitata TaxID=1303443 RepID=A0A9W4US19_9PLEO|nr:unnamed protein product [Periconia digitata]
MEVSTAPATAQTEGQRRRRPRNRNRNNTGPVQQPAQQDGPDAPPPVPAQRGGRSGRGRGRGSHTNNPRGRGQAPHASQVPSADASSAPPTNHQRGRGGQQRNPRFPGRAAGGRQFGGQLTVAANDEGSASTTTTDPSSSAGLQPDAPAFEPGRPLVARPPRPRKPQAPKSNAPDITTRTHEDIDNGHYECAICVETIKRTAKGVWSCRTCWTVFHLGCIKKWSTNEGSAAARQQAPDGELPPPRQWRCPGCNLPKDELPRSFSCWCEKESDPKPLAGIPPFSCGQTCSRSRILPKKCPHPCPTTCHAGPCPPCTQIGPTQHCFCSKKSMTRRCVDTDYENGWSCGDVCGQLMPCGEHFCPQPCHEGSCGVCEVRVPARCYCGQIEKAILCCDKNIERHSSRTLTAEDGSHAFEEWTGVFNCPNTCGRDFDCGKHTCEKPCHQQDSAPPHCPRSPDAVSHCPCGKTPLSEISGAVRTSCEDAIPNCSKPCANELACGHRCERFCHQGACPPCLRTMSILCRCGRTTSSTICHQGVEEPPQCMRVCRVSLNCGRHECGERCCPGERKAAERQAQRRKPRPLDSARQHRHDDGFEAEHIDTRSCGRQLRCGNPDHRCQELCHKGPCGTCREAIFDEISCNCGRTVLQPPLPCGTKPPPCRFPCERPKACGHPQVTHNCHEDEESCPKCPFLTTKACLCGKNTLKNQPCWLTEVRCGDICGAKLKCGAHRCLKQCHRPGECEEPCRQSCGKELTVCGHPCMAPCHSPSPCKEQKPCQHKIFITCECQRIKQEAKCGASKNTEGNHNKQLKCDEECARLERNRKLAVALNVDPAQQTDHVPYSADTLNMYQQNSAWASVQEKELRLFAAEPDQKRLRFKPMQRKQRAFLHSLAEDFGFDSESMDPEPHRHVAIFKTPRFVVAPMKSLAECVRIRQVQRTIAPAATPAPAPAISSRPKASITTADPYNAFLINNPRFALTIEEVRSALKTVLPKTSFALELDISFLPTEEVALKPPIAARINLPDRDVQTMLETLKTPLAQELAAQKIGTLQLARLDASLNILRTESDGVGAGWSQVAAKGGASARHASSLGSAPIGGKGGFAVLSLSSKAKKKKVPVQEVVDDWEAEEEKEEEREKERVSGVNSDAEGGAGAGEASGTSAAAAASAPRKAEDEASDEILRAFNKEEASLPWSERLEDD